MPDHSSPLTEVEVRAASIKAAELKGKEVSADYHEKVEAMVQESDRKKADERKIIADAYAQDLYQRLVESYRKAKYMPYSGSDGKQESCWDSVNKKSANASFEQKMYDTWQSAMMQILTDFGVLARAINADINYEIIKNKYIAMAAVPVIAKLKELKDAVSDKIFSKKFELPSLIYNLEMDSKNKINYGFLKGFDDASNFDLHFKTLVGLWLGSNGYEPAQDKDGAFINIQTKVELDANTFEELKKNTLDDFLKKYTDVKFEAGPELLEPAVAAVPPPIAVPPPPTPRPGP